ncbi:S-adenosyl-L-methionine-dependent methyltransferase [Sordaria brevicollis]|uniref:S-adenosyl-L-methionine-dependent methyltransferase n=1 Tax=Sordaria brevicollis TaxID=83679 RepID=A0AAE0UEX9_SORBR|nr:S-adenosyl-L-methionine-dependent methyltransferase [Sordaria brevicollis]
MSTPAKRKAQSPPAAPPPSSVPKTKTPTPESKSPAHRSPTLGSPAHKSPTPGSPTASGDVQEPTDILGGAYWLQQGLPESDIDSTLGGDDDDMSSTASISSSILRYRTINGRTYHSDAAANKDYCLPNDTKHLDALEIFTHAMDLMLGGKLASAPIEKDLKHAIDVGTASGLWAIDFADEHPGCEVIGTDISPVQPTWCPPNIQFEIEDANKQWTFKPDYFDYIHVRFMTGAISDWDHFYEQAYRVCKPGGWIEHIDTTANPGTDDGTIAKGSALEQYGHLFEEAGRRLGMTQTVAANNLQEIGLKKAGFINLTTQTFKMPVSPWPQDPKRKELGAFARAGLTGDIEGILQYVFGNVMGWSQEEIAVFTAHLRQELKDKDIHAYWKWKLVYAQKPLE